MCIELTRRRQRGGMVLGVVVGLLIGLALALGVALYIAKAPTPFVDKVQHRSPEEQAAEVEKLKNWDPNAGLAGKPAPITPPPGVRAAEAASAVTAPATAPALPTTDRDPAAILAGKPIPDPAVAVAVPKPVTAYFVQAGAYSNAEDAEQQRAKLAMQGISARTFAVEQGGRSVHRVRVGPFDTREEAQSQQARLHALGAESAIVRGDKP